jgi:hypothetical protein
MSETALEQAATNEAVTETPAPAPVIPLAELEDLSEYRARRDKGETGLEAPAEVKPAEQPAAEGEQPKPEAEQQQPAEGEQPPASGKKRTVQDRIDDLTRARRETERQLEAERAERARIAAELEAIRKGQQPEPQQPAEPVSLTGQPKPTIEDFDGQADPWGAYVSALAKWEAAEIVAGERLAWQREQAAHAYNVAQARAHEAGKSAHKDFDETIEAFAESGRKFSPIVTDVILNHPLGPSVAYALAKDPALADRISSLHPGAAMLEIGKVVSRLESASGSAPVAAPVTKAPAPIRPVGGVSEQSATTSDPSQIESVSEWRRVRKQFER